MRMRSLNVLLGAAALALLTCAFAAPSAQPPGLHATIAAVPSSDAVPVAMSYQGETLAFVAFDPAPAFDVNGNYEPTGFYRISLGRCSEMPASPAAATVLSDSNAARAPPLIYSI